MSEIDEIKNQRIKLRTKKRNFVVVVTRMLRTKSERRFSFSFMRF